MTARNRIEKLHLTVDANRLKMMIDLLIWNKVAQKSND